MAPKVEHYAWAVDVLSHSGKLNEAKDFLGWLLCRRKLVELGSQESSAYVLLSGIYTVLEGRVKERGCIWIELRCQVHVFVVGDEMHPHIGDICAEVRRLSGLMKDEEGYLVSGHFCICFSCYFEVSADTSSPNQKPMSNLQTSME